MKVLHKLHLFYYYYFQIIWDVIIIIVISIIIVIMIIIYDTKGLLSAMLVGTFYELQIVHGTNLPNS